MGIIFFQQRAQFQRACIRSYSCSFFVLCSHFPQNPYRTLMKKRDAINSWEVQGVITQPLNHTQTLTRSEIYWIKKKKKKKICTYMYIKYNAYNTLPNVGIGKKISVSCPTKIGENLCLFGKFCHWDCRSVTVLWGIRRKGEWMGGGESEMRWRGGGSYELSMLSAIMSYFLLCRKIKCFIDTSQIY